MNNSLIQRLFSIFLVIITIISLGIVFFQHREVYLSHNYWQQFPNLKQTYLDSQYVNKHPKGWIPDEIVNAYAGGAYMQGVLPQLIAPDTPPLGRYIVGISTLLFNNANILVSMIQLVSLVFLFLLGKQIFKNTTLALVPVTFLSLEQIFQNQFIYTPLLDGMQLTFLLSSFYFFNKGIRNKRKILDYLLAVIGLGLFISTKFFITGIVVAVAWFGVLLIHRKIKDISLLGIISPFAVIILVSNYIGSLWHGYSFMKFLGIQKYILLYHKSQLILPFSIWPLLFLNRWYVWFGDKSVISDPQWQFTWPIIAGISFLTCALYILKKIPQKLEVEILMFWSVVYILFFSFGQITTRYLVIYIPVLYVISLYGIQQIIKKYVLKKKV